MNEKPKKQPTHHTNQEVAERLFPKEVIEKIKKETSEKPKRQSKSNS